MNPYSPIAHSSRSFAIGLLAFISVLALLSVFLPLPRPYFYSVIGAVALTTYHVQKNGFPPLTSREKTVVSALGAIMCVLLDWLISNILSMGSFSFPILPHDATLGVSLAIMFAYTSAVFAITRFLFSSAA